MYWHMYKRLISKHSDHQLVNFNSSPPTTPLTCNYLDFFFDEIKVNIKSVFFSFWKKQTLTHKHISLYKIVVPQHYPHAFCNPQGPKNKKKKVAAHNKKHFLLLFTQLITTISNGTLSFFVLFNLSYFLKHICSTVLTAKWDKFLQTCIC